jgi:hypothetical protein
MKTIEENNTLIAVFMDVDQVDIDTWLEDNKELKYHSSWDWLMPVLKKIDSYANEVMSVDEFDNYRNSYRMISSPTHYDINYVWNQAVEFIKWYNEQNRFICGSCDEHTNEYTYNEDKDIDECNNCKEN